MSFQPDVTEGKVRSMTTTAIITAMESEYDSVRKLYDFDENGDYPRAHVYGRNILLVKAGIGKVNAALAAQKACDAGADLVISTGLAGGIDTSLRQGDIVLAEKVCYHDVWCGEPNQRGQVQGLPLYFEPRPEMMEKIIAAVLQTRSDRNRRPVFNRCPPFADNQGRVSGSSGCGYGKCGCRASLLFE